MMSNKRIIKYFSYTLVMFLTIFILTSCKFVIEEPYIKDPLPPVGEVIDIKNQTQYDFKDSLKTNGPLTEKCLPSKGDVNVLVVPISFNKTEKPETLRDINIAFNGTEEQTGYYSVSEFYKVSSYGQLNLHFDVLNEYYRPIFLPGFYEKSSNEYGSTKLFREILKYYDSTIDYNKYDNDKDGYIDALWMVYTEPVDVNNDFWWAYVANDAVINTLDGPKGFYYGFAGVDFLYPDKLPTKKEYPCVNIKVDAHTFIHETGHMMGLDDYYDYDTLLGVNNGGTYGIDYMDYNYGDHGPINKLLLDWVNPIIINDICDCELKPYQTSGEVYLVTKKFTGSIYESYYLIINYNNTLLYKKDPYFRESGLIVYEINAQKNIVNNVCVLNSGSYATGFKYDNSDENDLFVNILSTKPTTRDLLFKTHLLLTKGESLVLPKVNMKINVNSILINGNISLSFR